MAPEGYDYGNAGQQQPPPPGQYDQGGAPPPPQGGYGSPPPNYGAPPNAQQQQQYSQPPPAGNQQQQYGQPPTGTPPPPQAPNQQQYGQPPVGGPYRNGPTAGETSRGYGQPPPPPPPNYAAGGAPNTANDYEAAPPTPTDDDDEYQRDIMAQWDEHMNDFEPSDMLTINIPSRTDEVFYEYITETPSKVRGAYFIGSGEKKLIDFWIIDPSNRIYNTIQGKNEGLFVFDAEQQGIYQFVFSNSRYWEAKDLTFAIHFGKLLDRILVLFGSNRIYFSFEVVTNYDKL